MKCPRDRTVLTFTESGRFPCNRCSACQGMLLGADEVAAALGGRVPATGRIAALPESGVACPRDASTLRRLEHNGVELDLCAECGALWLDSGELDKIKTLGKGKRRAAAGAAAAVAGAAAATAIASQPQAQSVVASVAHGVGEVVAEGAIDIALEFVGDAVGALISGIF